MSTSLRRTIDLPAGPTAPRAARDELRRACAGRTSTSLSEDALLVVSELVTNAVRHGREPISLDMYVEATQVFLGVYDVGEPFVPSLGPVEVSASGGRGLNLVDLLSTSWAVHPGRPRGKSVWSMLTQSN